MARTGDGLGFYPGSHWMSGAVVALVIAALAAGLLNALGTAKDQAERLAVDLTVRNLRSGLQWAMAEAIFHRREPEVAAWAGTNPVRWLGSEPSGYRGECSRAERAALPARAWCFDRERHELVYRPADPGQLRRRGGGAACQDLAWRVLRTPESASAGVSVGLRIVATTDCDWVLYQ